MEVKDWATFGTTSIGIVAVFIVSALNYRHSRRHSKTTTYINVVTAERIKWISKVRENVSSFISIAEKLYRSSEEDLETMAKMVQLRYEIVLQLNANETEDTHLITLLGSLGERNLKHPNGIGPKATYIVQTTQKILKREWEKVKVETKSY